MIKAGQTYKYGQNFNNFRALGHFQVLSVSAEMVEVKVLNGTGRVDQVRNAEAERMIKEGHWKLIG